MAKSRGFWLRGGGCVFLITTCLSACGLLILNGILVATLYRWFSPLGPELLRGQRASQIILFAGPIVLMLVQWWLIDRLIDALRRPRDTP